MYMCIAIEYSVYTHDVNTHTKSINKNIIRHFGRGLLQSNKQRQIERVCEREIDTEDRHELKGQTS